MFTVWRPLRMRPTICASINAASATDQITGQHYHISPLSREHSRQPHRRQQRRHNSHSPVHLRSATTLGTTPGRQNSATLPMYVDVVGPRSARTTPFPSWPHPHRGYWRGSPTRYFLKLHFMCESTLAHFGELCHEPTGCPSARGGHYGGE
jgi:hypothetical protein